MSFQPLFVCRCLSVTLHKYTSRCYRIVYLFKLTLTLKFLATPLGVATHSLRRPALCVYLPKKGQYDDIIYLFILLYAEFKVRYFIEYEMTI